MQKNNLKVKRKAIFVCDNCTDNTQSIIEDIMRDIMFEIPSNPNIEKCIITKDTVLNNAGPETVINAERKEHKPAIKKKRQVPKNQNEKETA